MTICTHDRALIFDEPWMKMVAERASQSVTGRRPPAYEFVVMPNHVHGIIWLPGPGRRNAQHGTATRDSEYQPSDSPEGRTAKPGAALLRTNVAPDSLGAKVRAFKAATTRRINARRGTLGARVWQPDYYEHVVRNDADLHRIRQYISDNPAKWADDPENPSNAVSPS